MVLYQISPMHKKWENDYYAVTSMEYNAETKQAFINQSLTNTFKLAPYKAGASALFFGADKSQIGRNDFELECPPGGIFGGAGHVSHQWQAKAPEGTQGFALAQYYHPEGLAAVGEAVGNFFGNIGEAIANAATAAEQWCDQNPQACGAIAITAFIIGGTALCLALGPEVCTIELVIVAPTG
jgi:hypothetical protein